MGVMKRLHDARVSGEPIPAAVYRVFAPQYLDPAPQLKQETEEAVVSNLMAGPSRQGHPPAAELPVALPLWYWTVAGHVVAEQALRPGDVPRLWCREGSAWTEYRTGSPPVHPRQSCGRNRLPTEEPRHEVSTTPGR